jgi:hypothetical protein
MRRQVRDDDLNQEKRDIRVVFQQLGERRPALVRRREKPSALQLRER